MGLLSFFNVLRARSLIVLWSIVIATFISAVLGFALPKNYVASAKVQVDSVFENPLTGLAEKRHRVSEFLGQQAALVSSRSVALKVVAELIATGHLSMAEYEDQWRKKTGGEIVTGNNLTEWVADELLLNLNVQSSVTESTMLISYRSNDPSLAARYANAFADSYMRIVIDNRQRRAARTAANFSEETRNLERQVQKSRDELTDFQAESGLVTIGAQQLEAAEVELGTITSRIADARADYAEARSLLSQAVSASRAELATLPIPNDNNVGKSAQARLGSIRVQMEKVEQRYGENHPDYQEGLMQMRSLQTALFQSIRERADYARRRIASLEAAAAIQKARVIALQKTRQTFNVLEQGLANNQQTFDEISRRRLQQSLQSRFDLVDILMLGRAVPPQEPPVPIHVIVIIAGFFLGVCLGISAAILTELVEARIRVKAMLERVAQAPVFAEVTVSGPRGKGQFA